jgi:hypothetical protein
METKKYEITIVYEALFFVNALYRSIADSVMPNKIENATIINSVNSGYKREPKINKIDECTTLSFIEKFCFQEMLRLIIHIENERVTASKISYGIVIL